MGSASRGAIVGGLVVLCAAVLWADRWTSADGGSTAAPQQPQTQGPVSPEVGTVVHVFDGDSMEVRRDGVTEQVRVIGIDAPERGECGAEAARHQARHLLDGVEVTLVPGAEDDRDRYDRLLRYIEIDGADYGLAMINSGLAIARYDSRSGQPHDREQQYWQADRATEHICPEFDQSW